MESLNTNLELSSPFSLCELPTEVLSLCLSRGLDSPRDLASVVGATKRLHSVGSDAPVNLRLQLRSGTTPAESRQKLWGVCSSFPATASLDASGFPIEDADVEELVARLPGLSSLLLSNCKKLTGRVTASVFHSGSTPAPSSPSKVSPSPSNPGPGLRVVVMQRCFQLAAEALSDALLAGMAPGGHLEAAALSHLDLRGWPGAPLASLLAAQAKRALGEVPDSASKLLGAAGAAAVGTGDKELLDRAATGSASSEPSAAAELLAPAALPPRLAALVSAAPRGLRLLALHNCVGLSIGALQALGAACPSLEALFLGGCTLALQEASAHSPQGAASVAADLEDGGVGAAGLVRSSGGGGGGDGTQQLHAPAIELAPGPAAALLPELLAGCDGSMRSMRALQRAAASALGRCRMAQFADGLVQEAAALFAALATALPRLQVLELSFVLPGLVPLLQELAEAGWEGLQRQGQAACPQPAAASGSGATVQFWDLCQHDSVQQALAWRRSSTVARRPGGEAAVGAFLRAAANCSSGSKVTPLHVAAEEGRCDMAQDLLALGANVLARDRSGASPLFAACEVGQAAAAACLLRSGGDVLQRNSAGEACLYIAALRGHGAVVQVLLEHCRATGVRWEAPELYGDGWTPLMAAAVGRRTAIARQLLAAAGPLAGPLVHATNRYGMTACHIAARRASLELVQILVEAGGPGVVGVRDTNGRTAACVAKRNGNVQVWELLRALGGEEEEGEGGQEGRKGRRRRKAAAAAAAAAVLPPPGWPSAASSGATTAAGVAGDGGAAATLACPQPPSTSGQWVGRRLGARKSQASAQE